MGVVVASSGQNALFALTPDRQTHQHHITQFLTSQLLFLTPSQHSCQSTKGNYSLKIYLYVMSSIWSGLFDVVVLAALLFLVDNFIYFNIFCVESCFCYSYW